MLFAALAHLMLQSPASVPDAFRESPASAPVPAAETIASSEGATVPEWALTDPFGYERARCNPMARGETPLDVCQSRVRSALAASLGDDLPDALRPPGMAGDCQMVQAAAGGSDYGLQCGDRPRNATASAAPQEMDCRPRPEGGGFSSECRPVNGLQSKGLKLRLWGDD
ncbi:hypothetical protein [Brevundimonas sp. UBA7534]|uniref:hypothetical protein n=1 Tax=Brevundimonas sp. UBA7534 TaxID=1946138 RepID=UPI0025C5A289|nr:hypothetical protein [Brevundimonas sp. UBA7534]